MTRSPSGPRSVTMRVAWSIASTVAVIETASVRVSQPAPRSSEETTAALPPPLVLHPASPTATRIPIHASLEPVMPILLVLPPPQAV